MIHTPAPHWGGRFCFRSHWAQPLLESKARPFCPGGISHGSEACPFACRNPAVHFSGVRAKNEVGFLLWISGSGRALEKGEPPLLAEPPSKGDKPASKRFRDSKVCVLSTLTIAGCECWCCWVKNTSGDVGFCLGCTRGEISQAWFTESKGQLGLLQRVLNLWYTAASGGFHEASTPSTPRDIAGNGTGFDREP
jgi:hypothetical protein